MRLCVSCGSSSGNNPYYTAAASDLGKLLPARRIGLVYGGGRGADGHHSPTVRCSTVARSSASFLAPSWTARSPTPQCRDRRIVGTIHERKTLMAQLADGFVALPGREATLDELFEAWTWRQLGLHHKPCGLLNVGGYCDDLGAFLDRSVTEGFLPPEYRAMLVVDHAPQDLLDQPRRTLLVRGSNDCLLWRY